MIPIRLLSVIIRLLLQAGPGATGMNTVRFAARSWIPGPRTTILMEAGLITTQRVIREPEPAQDAARQRQDMEIIRQPQSMILITQRSMRSIPTAQSVIPELAQQQRRITPLRMDPGRGITKPSTAEPEPVPNAGIRTMNTQNMPLPMDRGSPWMGRSIAALEPVRADIRRMSTASTDCRLGTGKTTAAKIIHSHSQTKDKKMVSYSLSTVVESLAESTFFGHVKGSYTNAENERIGLFEAADGGTLFLDELGVASLDVQAMLLTVLETGNFKKVGTQKEQHVDVRLIFATNADITRMLRDGSFRSDLYFRICDNIIKLPPLRERKEDIWEMVESYIVKEDFMIKEDALERLENYSWPGNIRELHKCLRRAMVRSKDHVIGAEQIDFGDVSFLQ